MLPTVSHFKWFMACSLCFNCIIWTFEIQSLSIAWFSMDNKNGGPSFPKSACKGCTSLVVQTPQRSHTYYTKILSVFWRPNVVGSGVVVVLWGGDSVDTWKLACMSTLLNKKRKENGDMLGFLPYPLLGTKLSYDICEISVRCEAECFYLASATPSSQLF